MRDDSVRLLLEGEHDVDAHRHFLAGADVRPFHDAPAGPGDDHPAGLGHLTAELDRLAVRPIFTRCSGRAKDGDFELAAIRGEDLECVPQFPQNPRKDFQIAPRGTVGGQLVRRLLDLVDQRGTLFGNR